MMATCSSRGCTAPAKRGCRKMCNVHYRRKVRLGVFGYVDKTKARDHIRALRALGWTYERIEQAAGIAARQAWSIEHGEYRRVLRDNEARILSVALVTCPILRGFDSIGTTRRLQALQWMGWPAKEIAARVGSTESTIRSLKGRKRFSTSLAMRIAAVYEQLSMTAGPSPMAAAKARGAGHAPPAAWDDDTIDDPDAKPQGVLRRKAGAR